MMGENALSLATCPHPGCTVDVCWPDTFCRQHTCTVDGCKRMKFNHSMCVHHLHLSLVERAGREREVLACTCGAEKANEPNHSGWCDKKGEA